MRQAKPFRVQQQQCRYYEDLQGQDPRKLGKPFREQQRQLLSSPTEFESLGCRPAKLIFDSSMEQKFALEKLIRLELWIEC